MKKIISGLCVLCISLLTLAGCAVNDGNQSEITVAHSKAISEYDDFGPTHLYAAVADSITVNEDKSINLRIYLGLDTILTDALEDLSTAAVYVRWRGSDTTTTPQLLEGVCQSENIFVDYSHYVGFMTADKLDYYRDFTPPAEIAPYLYSTDSAADAVEESFYFDVIFDSGSYYRYVRTLEFRYESDGTTRTLTLPSKGNE